MSSNEQPYIADSIHLPELTFKVIIIAIVLTIVLALSNAYLALKIGLLTSASIPAAVLSMGILRFFKEHNILENNLVQTAASAGEAVAGGIVYTVPALIIIHYWFHFDYMENFLIALIGGVLGVLFSIPIRRVLVTDKSLPFPEGKAIAEVLKLSADNAVGFKELLMGGTVGALIELAQTGFKVVANSWQVWFVAHRGLFGFGGGFSATMIGAGYLIGFNLCSSIFIGALVGWLLGVPVLSEFFPNYIQGNSATHMVTMLWGAKLRYVGIGSMLLAGVWTMSTLLKPFIASLKLSVQAVRESHRGEQILPRTQRDMPLQYVLSGIVLVIISMTFYFANVFPLAGLGLGSTLNATILFGSVLYIVIFGFIFSAITAYFSGMVGVTATPGSSVIIGAMLIAALALSTLLQTQGITISEQVLTDAEAITIIIGAVIMGAAAISNDNIQDLKVGYILGATPWRQQVMLILGVVVSAMVIPLVMQLLFNVYGIADVMPRAGMDLSQSLPAPPAALMAAITQGVFHHNLPWDMVGVGMGITLLAIAVNHPLKKRGMGFSVLGMAIGIYLPLASSIPIFIGGLIAYVAKLGKHPTAEGKHRGVLLACGLVAGAALMDVLLAIPFSILHSPNALMLVGDDWAKAAVVLGVVTTLALAAWFYRVVKGVKS